jgi:hypothetical protein
MPTVRAMFETVPDPGETSGVPFDPSPLTVTTRSPSGAVVGYTVPDATLSSPVTGTWDFTFPDPLTETGKWVVSFVGGGASASTWFTIERLAAYV